MLLGVAFLLVLPAFPQEKTVTSPPTAGNVTLSLDEYNRLLALANRPGKKAEAPPLPYLLKHAELKLRVVNDGVLGSIEFSGETLSENMAKVPLLTGATVLDAVWRAPALRAPTCGRRPKTAAPGGRCP